MPEPKISQQNIDQSITTASMGMLFLSPFSGFNVMANQCMFKKDTQEILALFLCENCNYGAIVISS